MDVYDLHKLSDRTARASGGLSYLGFAGGRPPRTVGSASAPTAAAGLDGDPRL